MSVFRSLADNGRRYAALPRSDTICSAQGRASLGDVGRQVKMRRRLGVSDTPVGLNGPVTTKSEMCGTVVIPYWEPICVSAMLWPMGEMLSLTGPSKVRTNAAEMRCEPARTGMGLVLSSIP